jgi:hypothetical protein
MTLLPGRRRAVRASFGAQVAPQSRYSSSIPPAARPALPGGGGTHQLPAPGALIDDEGDTPPPHPGEAR